MDNISALKQIYKSSIRASYFNGMKSNRATEKSKLQIQAIQENQEDNVDENTFRLLKSFKRTASIFAVFKKKGNFYIQEKSIFSCFVNRAVYQVEVINTIMRMRIKNSDKTKFFLDFNLVSAKVIKRNTYFELKVYECQHVFYFEPENNSKAKQVCEDWCEFLDKVIKESAGSKNNFSYLARKDADFYKSQAVSNEQFEKNANSCDVVLFKSEHSAARIQRIFTDSEYDHVGLVVRNRKNELFIYQSTSNQGVGLTPWKHMVKYEWYQSTTKIAWRSLNVHLNQRDIETVEKFIAKTLGKDFELNLEKIFIFSSKLERTAEEQQSKTYFCSELVARLYKELGFIDKVKSSTQYYPVDFTDKGNIRFTKPDISFKPEKIISFDGVNS